MDTSLKVFNWQGQMDLTTITDKRDGSLWFVAREVCDILGYGHVPHALRILDNEERGVHKLDTRGGAQDCSTITESGLYSLILRSRKPDAKRFKRWVTGDVPGNLFAE